MRFRNLEHAIWEGRGVPELGDVAIDSSLCGLYATHSLWRPALVSGGA